MLERLFGKIIVVYCVCIQVQHVGMHRSQYHYIIGSLVSALGSSLASRNIVHIGLVTVLWQNEFILLFLLQNIDMSLSVPVPPCSFY